jgi:mono/diheme cytochrome c family protein
MAFLTHAKGAAMTLAGRTAARLLIASIACSSSALLAQGKPIDVGKREYESNCAGCHGLGGRGDGPNASLLSTPAMPDLSTLAARNGGVFPLARVYEVIDGRVEIRAHGVRDMPIWGDEYRARTAETVGAAPHDAEYMVRSRILALVDYLNRLQRR